MKTHVDIGDSEVLTLKGALLVYQGRHQGFVTWHEVRRLTEAGAPFLGEAHAVTTDFVHHLAGSLAIRIPMEILPENVLVRTAETVVWWTPSMTRTMFFAAYDPEAHQLNGKRFCHPPLVWKTDGKELWVRAMSESRRPVAATPLKIAPYWNVDGETGRVCQGSMRSPDEPGVGAAAGWERAFFQSEFTHHSGTRRLTSHPEGFLGLWRSLTGGRRRFPVKLLTSAQETLQEFVVRR